MGGGQKAGEICHLLFSARLPAYILYYILYLMHLFCIGVSIYILSVSEVCRDLKVTSFLTVRPAVKATPTWTVSIHQVDVHLSLFLHPGSRHFRLNGRPERRSDSVGSHINKKKLFFFISEMRRERLNALLKQPRLSPQVRSLFHS